MAVIYLDPNNKWGPINQALIAAIGQVGQAYQDKKTQEAVLKAAGGGDANSQNTSSAVNDSSRPDASPQNPGTQADPSYAMMAGPQIGGQTPPDITSPKQAGYVTPDMLAAGQQTAGKVGAIQAGAMAEPVIPPPPKPPDMPKIIAAAQGNPKALALAKAIGQNYTLQRQQWSEQREMAMFDAQQKRENLRDALALKKEGREESHTKFEEASTATNQAISKARLDLETLRNQREQELDPLKRQELSTRIKLANANLTQKLQDNLLMSKAEAAPTGTHALDGLDNVTQNTVKGMVDGTLSPPSSWAMQQPRWRAYVALAKQLDPSFDESKWQQRVETQKDYGSGGKTGQAFRYGNNLIGHLFALDKAYDALGNSNSRLANSIRNTIRQQVRGDPEFTSFSTVQQVVAEEARKFFAAAGGGSLTELKQFEKAFSPNATPAQGKAAIHQLLDMMHTQYDTVAENWNRVMNQKKGAFDFITPRNKQLWQTMVGPEKDLSYSNNSAGGNGIPQGAPTASSKDGRKAYWDGQKWQIVQ